MNIRVRDVFRGRLFGRTLSRPRKIYKERSSPRQLLGSNVLGRKLTCALTMSLLPLFAPNDTRLKRISLHVFKVQYLPRSQVRVKRPTPRVIGVRKSIRDTRVGRDVNSRLNVKRASSQVVVAPGRSVDLTVTSDKETFATIRPHRFRFERTRDSVKTWFF